MNTFTKTEQCERSFSRLLYQFIYCSVDSYFVLMPNLIFRQVAIAACPPRIMGGNGALTYIGMLVKIIRPSYINLKPQSEAPFTLLPFCAKTERKISVFVKVFTLIRKKRHKNGCFRKCYQKWISTKTEVFENAFDQCERPGGGGVRGLWMDGGLPPGFQKATLL